jgi:hypothetical protein
MAPTPESAPLRTFLRTEIQRTEAPVWPASATFELRYIATRRLIREYRSEGAALAFVRDVVRLGGREPASQFELLVADRDTLMYVAGGVGLVQRALEDRV